MTDSYTLSEWLLVQQGHNASEQPPQYGGVTWADPNVLKGFAEFAVAWRSSVRRLQGLVTGLGLDTGTLMQYWNLLVDVPSGVSEAVSYALIDKADPADVRDALLPWLRRVLLGTRGAGSGGGVGKGGGSGGSSTGGSGKRRLQQRHDRTPGTAPNEGSGGEETAAAAADVAQRAAMLAALLQGIGLDEATSGELAGLLARAREPASREELIRRAAGGDEGLASELRRRLADGLPDDPDQLLELIGIILQGPLGDPLRPDATDGPGLLPADLPGFPPVPGMDGGGGFAPFPGWDGGGLPGSGLPADARGVEALLAGLVTDALGLQDREQGEKVVKLLLPLVSGLLQVRVMQLLLTQHW